jgi:hypothetical protein
MARFPAGFTLVLAANRAELLSDRQLTEPSAVVADRVREARLRVAASG